MNSGVHEGSKLTGGRWEILFKEKKWERPSSHQSSSYAGLKGKKIIEMDGRTTRELQCR